MTPERQSCEFQARRRGFNVLYAFALNSEVDGRVLPEARWGFYPVDAALWVRLGALQDQPVLGHHDFAGSSQVEEEYRSRDAAFCAHFVVDSADRSGSLSDHRADGHGGGKFLMF